MDKKNAPIVVDDIHLLRIEAVQQKLDVAAFKKQKEHMLNLGYKIAHNLADERIKLELVLSFENSLKQQLLFFQIDFHFHIQHLGNFYALNDGNLPIFASNAVAVLLGICISTARGIILEKLSNAGIPNIIIPVVSPKELIKSNH